MSLILGDGFDHYPTALILNKWDAVRGNSSDIHTDYGRLGSQGVRCVGSYSSCIQKNLPAANSGFGFLGAAIFIPNYTGSFSRTIFSVFEPVGSGGYPRTQATLSLEQDGSFSIRYIDGGFGMSAPFSTSDPGLVPAGTWCYIEWKIKTHSSSGESYVRVNGQPVTMSVETGMNTARTSSNNWFTQVGLGGGGTAGTPETLYADDFYYCDDQGSVNNDFLGDVQLQAIYPDGAGSSTDWTPNTGDNWDAVNETSPDDDSTYVSSNVVNDFDLYTMQDMSATAADVKGLLCNARIKKDDATAREYALLVESGGTTGELATRTTPYGAYTNQQDVSELNPDTSALWTVSEVNAMTAGIKVKS